MTQTTRTNLAMRGFALGALTAAAVAVAAAPALAAPGDLDPAFGTGGISVFGSQTVGLDVAKVMLVQPDGKLVIAGSDGTKDFLVHRLHADGSPDRGFGGDGTVTADFANRDDTITGIALQGDGKLVAAGRSAVGLDERPVVARFTTGGAVDPAFGAGGEDGDGRVTLGAGAATDLQAVAVLPGGGIALAGATPTFNKDFAVTRLRTDGSVDDVAYEPVPSADGNDTLVAAARTPGGKLVVAGSLYRAATPGQPVTGVARYGADGKLDRTFGAQGLTTLPGMSQPHTIMPTDEGGLVLVGTSLAGDTSTMVARLDQDGRPDEGFGSGGIVDVGFPGLDVPAGLGVLDDGRILVGGTLGTELAFGAARLTADGRADALFGNDGMAVIPVGERALSTAGASAPGGTFVLAGPAVLPGPLNKLAVTRLQGDPPPVPPVDDPPAGGPATGDPQPQPAADEQPPAVTDLRVSRRVAGARPRIRFTLSEAAHVTVTLKRRHGRSTRVDLDAAAGANRLHGARRLVRGRYRLTVVAVDPAGNAAPPARVRFKVRAR